MLQRHDQGMLRNPSGRLNEQKVDPILNCVWRYRASQQFVPILPHLGARATPTTPNMLQRHDQGMIRNPSGRLNEKKSGPHIELRVALSHQSMIRSYPSPPRRARATPTTPKMLQRHEQGMPRDPSGRLDEQNMDPILNCVWRYRASQGFVPVLPHLGARATPTAPKMLQRHDQGMPRNPSGRLNDKKKVDPRLNCLWRYRTSQWFVPILPHLGARAI